MLYTYIINYNVFIYKNKSVMFRKADFLSWQFKITVFILIYFKI